MDRLESMRALVRVMEAGRFAAAARDMGLSRAAVNRAVISLEEALGALVARFADRPYRDLVD